MVSCGLPPALSQHWSYCANLDWPLKGRVYDPCCGSGGMFVSSEKFIEAHAGRLGDISIYGQESNYTTWRLCKMNLAIRGIDGQIAHGDTFHDDKNPDLKADYVLAKSSTAGAAPGGYDYWNCATGQWLVFLHLTKRADG
jgi:type I restriction-modification system DNA methylase subunit